MTSDAARPIPPPSVLYAERYAWTDNGHLIWLFAGSQAGGERAAAIYSVIETAKLNGIEPQAYIADVIAKIAGGWPASRWDDLMPWNWAQDQTPIAQAA